jgi:thymidine phosphorylase
MVETGERMGKKVVALITDMDQPLGLQVGNSLDVAEAVEVLRGEGPEDLRELCLELAGWMFRLGGVASTVDEGRERAERLIKSGVALEKFRRMVELQGGDVRMIDDLSRLPQAGSSLEVASPRSGYVMAIACEAMGTACVILGGGREKKEDMVDPSVGLVLHKKVGDAVKRGEAMCTIHYNSESRAARAKRLIEESYQIGNGPPAKTRRLVHRVIQRSGRDN